MYNRATTSPRAAGLKECRSASLLSLDAAKTCRRVRSVLRGEAARVTRVTHGSMRSSLQMHDSPGCAETVGEPSAAVFCTTSIP